MAVSSTSTFREIAVEVMGEAQAARYLTRRTTEALTTVALERTMWERLGKVGTFEDHLRRYGFAKLVRFASWPMVHWS